MTNVLASSATLPARSELTQYWDTRSESYSNYVQDELHDWRHIAWRDALLKRLPPLCNSDKTHTPRILDLGCGPGFFEVILSSEGFEIDALDGSMPMLACAQRNVERAGDMSRTRFHYGDVSALPFPDACFDVVMSRNVSWLLTDPKATYKEWLRVLRVGGKLLIFDANWYGYLANESMNQQRANDQLDASVLEWSDDSFASTDQEAHCEALARSLPLTYVSRPSWDAEILPQLGYSDVWMDEGFAHEVWNEGELEYYATSPLFAIEATKGMQG
ncbi:class I SAM-dependent methyltransferase [Collinsella sp. AGMB00827]|uniref:Class I SAM-dependent methyltransferase n=1 Tax=Collinsella ureilytica TaxID=2869515 RepID=A0ABS7MHT1_9ACTN|nr:class I SAM-dependent methyltransferase [Collinsella urealyticum]MBY4796914.1 class I SAM-dependent methyltransferase [Collinsella urealyticum]